MFKVCVNLVQKLVQKQTVMNWVLLTTRFSFSFAPLFNNYSRTFEQAKLATFNLLGNYFYPFYTRPNNNNEVYEKFITSYRKAIL